MFPRLKERNWPFTVFVNTEAVDREFGNYMVWPQIEEMAANGAELGNHSHSHDHLVRLQPGETENQWQQRITEDIGLAGTTLFEKTGVAPTLFAYPYGEYSTALQVIVQNMGYFGIAQKSGAVSSGTDFLAVPRFPMSVSYSNMNRFGLSVNSRSLLAKVDEEINPSQQHGQLASLSLSLQPDEYRIKQLVCYSATGTALEMISSEASPLQIKVNAPESQPAGRNKINCTAPSNLGKGVFYWFSHQWLVKEADGSWYQG